MRNRVLMYSAAMKAGHWRETHQPIAFDHDGVLIDGQHRLSAIIHAGVPVTLSAVYDADASTMAVVDTGRGRTPGQILGAAGYANGARVAATARHFLVYGTMVGETRMVNGSDRNNYTGQDILDFLSTPNGQSCLNAQSGAIRAAATFGRIGAVTWLAASAALLEATGADVQLRSEFTEKLEAGAMLPVGSPILAYRNWITSDTGYARLSSQVAAFTAMVNYVKAWNAWLNGATREHVGVYRPGTRIPAPLPHRDTLEDIA